MGLCAFRLAVPLLFPSFSPSSSFLWSAVPRRVVQNVHLVIHNADAIVYSNVSGPGLSQVSRKSHPATGSHLHCLSSSLLGLLVVCFYMTGLSIYSCFDSRRVICYNVFDVSYQTLVEVY